MVALFARAKLALDAVAARITVHTLGLIAARNRVAGETTGSARGRSGCAPESEKTGKKRARTLKPQQCLLHTGHTRLGRQKCQPENTRIKHTHKQNNTDRTL